MSLFKKVKKKFDKEPISLEEPETKSMTGLKHYSEPEELKLRPRPPAMKKEPQIRPKPSEKSSVNNQLSIINSKLDMIKTQLDSLNNAFRLLSRRLK